MKNFFQKYWVAIACALLIANGGLINGTMDKLQFHYGKSIFPKGDEKLLGKTELFWNPSISWRNKYKAGDPALGEKFPGSTTWLVSLTDGWHVLKTMMMLSYHFAILLALVHLFSWPRWLLLGTPLLNLTFGFFFTLMFVYVLDRARRKQPATAAADNDAHAIAPVAYASMYTENRFEEDTHNYLLEVMGDSAKLSYLDPYKLSGRNMDGCAITQQDMLLEDALDCISRDAAELQESSS